MTTLYCSKFGLVAKYVYSVFAKIPMAHALHSLPPEEDRLNRNQMLHSVWEFWVIPVVPVSFFDGTVGLVSP